MVTRTNPFREDRTMAGRLAVLVLLLVPVLGVAGEKPKRAYLGVQIGYEKEKQVIFIVLVQPDSPAKKAGLRANDVLVRIDGAKPATLQAAVKVIQSLKPG